MALKSDPRRLPRRNHYQEGPGFLFVATQGGRPPETTAARGAAAVVRRRRGALRRWADGEPIELICRDIGCSRATLFRWRARFEKGGAQRSSSSSVGPAMDQSGRFADPTFHREVQPPAWVAVPA